MTRALVILRLGATHRVSGWAKTPRAARDWRLVLSPYQPVPDLDGFDPDEILPREGGKWDVLHDLLTERPDLLAAAPRLWLPDDDIETDAPALARFLNLAEAERLELAQPALTHDSEVSHAITLRHPLTRLRRTDFVEQMAPLLAPHVLRAALPDMKGRPAAKGLDFTWQDHVRDPRRIAILDATPMAHRRPLGRHLAGRARAAGADIDAEREAWIAARLGRWRRPRMLSRAGRPGAFALALAGLALSPRLWRTRRARRLARHLLAQLACAPRLPRPGRPPGAPPAPAGGGRGAPPARGETAPAPARPHS
ncbi:MAG: DUF707 domain-containing protein [Pseudomonadota bacterium]